MPAKARILAACLALVVEAKGRLCADRQRRFAGPWWFYGPRIGGNMDRTAGLAARPTKVRQVASGPPVGRAQKQPVLCEPMPLAVTSLRQSSGMLSATTRSSQYSG